MIGDEDEHAAPTGAPAAQYELAANGETKSQWPKQASSGASAFPPDHENIWKELLDDSEEIKAHEQKHLEREAAGRTRLASDALKRASEILSTQGASALLHSGEKRLGRGRLSSLDAAHQRNESLEHGVLADFGLEDEPGSQRNERGREFPVSDLDMFFSRMYYYHYERGFHACVSNGVVSLITLGFTLLLSTLIFAFIDWGQLLTCTDEEHCNTNFADYWTSRAVRDPNGWHILVWLYCAFFSAYWVVVALRFAQRVKDAIEMHRFYEKDLGVPDSALASGAISWAAVVERFQEMHRAGKIKVAIGRAAEALDAHWIAARIMRKENYLIAIMNHGVLDLHLPWRKWMEQGVVSVEMWGNAAFELVQQAPFGEDVDELRRPLRSGHGGFSGGSELFSYPNMHESEAAEEPQIGASQDELQLIATTKIHVRRNRLWAEGADVAFFNKSIEWALHACFLGYVFNDAFTMRKDFLRNRKELQLRFMLAGIAHLVLMPFLLVFMLAVFFLQHAQEWRTSNNYLGPREWSPLAKFMFREFNELPHVFEDRLAKSISPATEYQSCFSRPMLATAGRVISFVSGALVAVLLLFTLLEESILLYTKLWGRNLLWYMGIFSATFAVTRGLGMPASRERRKNVDGNDPLFDPLSTEDLMTKVRLPNAAKAAGDDGSGTNGGGDSSGTTANTGDASDDFATIRGQLEPDGHPKIAQELMLRVAAYTHYLPDAWRNHCHTLFVRDAFLRLFQYKAALFAQEALAVVVAPLILCFCLPACADRILKYMALYSVNVDGVGTVCSFSTFDVANYGDPTFIDSSIDDEAGESRAPEAGPELGDSPAIRPLQVSRTPGSEHRPASASSFDLASEYRDPRHGTSVDGEDGDDGDAAFGALPPDRQREVLRGVLEGKMEKSLISFAAEHPSWRPPPSAFQFLARVERLKFMATEHRRQEILQDMAESRNMQDQAAAHLFRSTHGEIPQPAAGVAASGLGRADATHAKDPGPYQPPMFASRTPDPTAGPTSVDIPLPTNGVAEARQEESHDAHVAGPSGACEAPSEPQPSPPPDSGPTSPQGPASVMTSPSKQYPFARESSDSSDPMPSGQLRAEHEKLSEPVVPHARRFPGAFRGALPGALNDEDDPLSSTADGAVQRADGRQAWPQGNPLAQSNFSGLLSPPPSMSPPLWSAYRRPGGQTVTLVGVESMRSFRRGSSGSGTEATASSQVFRAGANPFLAGSTSSFNIHLGGSSIMNVSQLQSGSVGLAMSHQAMVRAAALASIGSGYQPWDNSFYWMEQVQARNQRENPNHQGPRGSYRLGSPDPGRRLGASIFSVDEEAGGGAGGGAAGPERTSRPPPAPGPTWTRAGHVRHRQPGNATDAADAIDAADAAEREPLIDLSASEKKEEVYDV